MNTRIVTLAAAGLLAALPVLGQIIAPPTPTTPPTPATAAAATAPADTLPAPEKIMENLLRQNPGSPPATPVATPTTLAATPALPGAAPNQPETTRLREGQAVWNRVGRLVKDEKSGGWVLAFDSDGTQMQDPPMALLPCRLLESMESLSDKGTKPLKFKVAGQVTEYHGKNYLLITSMQTVRDMNQF